jgi:hypothetical protein
MALVQLVKEKTGGKYENISVQLFPGDQKKK